MSEFENLGKHTLESKDPAFLLYQRYIAPFTYGPFPYETGNKTVNNGTVFFIQGKETFAVTAAHCVNSFFERQRNEPNIWLRIGSEIFWDIESRIIDKDDILDICTFRFSKDDLKRVGSEKSFLIMTTPPQLQADSTVCIIGYPGQILRPVSERTLEIGLLGVFEIIREGNIGHGSFLVEFRKDAWIMSKNESNIKLAEFNKIGGMSGCPIIFQGKLSPALAGIVFENIPSFKEDGEEYLCGVRARFMCFDENGNLVVSEDTATL